MGANRAMELRWDGLSWKQRKFVLVYVETGNAAESARRAGYAGGAVSGFQVMAQPEVQRALVRESDAIRAKYNLSLENTLGRLEAIAGASMRDYLRVDDDGKITVDLRGLSADEWAAIKTVKETPAGWVVELHDKVAANLAIGRHLGMGLGKARLIIEERRERTKLANIMAELSPDEVTQLSGLGKRIEQIARDKAKTIDGEAQELPADTIADDAETQDDP